jgi:hypothetical protein
MTTANASPDTVLELRFEQYKLMVESAEHNSDRRAATHRFYTTMHTSLLTLLTLIAGSGLLASVIAEETFFLPLIGVPTKAQVPVIVGVSILGLFLCLLWSRHLDAFRRLSTAKFSVINRIEQDLPYQAFDDEWKVLKDAKRHRDLTSLERVVPGVAAFLYLAFIAGAIVLPLLSK